MEPIKALAVHKDNSGCSYHRVALPFQFSRDEVDHAAFTGDLENRLKNADIVIWNRDFPGGGINAAIKAKNKYGFKVCVDLDDYWQLYPDHYLFENYKKNKTAKIIKQNIMFADVVTVTTERLAEKVRQIHPNVHVIPNALPYGQGQFQTFNEVLNRRQFNFMYAGQKSHLHDVAMIRQVLLHVSKKHPSAGFVLAGYHASPDGVWQDIEKAFTSNQRLNNYQRIENRPLELYMTVYRHADAVIVPLQDNEFNSYKSNLKILEAGVFGLPVICQRVPPYSDCDAPVLFADTANDWVHYMEALMTGPQYAMGVGANIAKWCRENHDLFYWNKKRFELYKNTIHGIN